MGFPGNVEIWAKSWKQDGCGPVQERGDPKTWRVGERLWELQWPNRGEHGGLERGGLVTEEATLLSVGAGAWKSDGAQSKSPPYLPFIGCVTLDQKQGVSEPVSSLMKCGCYWGTTCRSSGPFLGRDPCVWEAVGVGREQVDFGSRRKGQCV